MAQLVVLAHASGAAPGPPEPGEGAEPASAGRHARCGGGGGGGSGDSDPEEDAIPPGRRRRSRSGHRGGGGGGGGSGGGGGGAPALVVANIHVLFNPRRGDVKLAQVRACSGISSAALPLENSSPPEQGG